jgi:hypothetical protein
MTGRRMGICQQNITNQASSVNQANGTMYPAGFAQGAGFEQGAGLGHKMGLRRGMGCGGRGLGRGAGRGLGRGLGFASVPPNLNIQPVGNPLPFNPNTNIDKNNDSENTN